MFGVSRASLRRGLVVVACLISSVGVSSCDDGSSLGRNGILRLDTPVIGQTYRGGDSVFVLVDLPSAHDASLQYSWWVELHHDSHVHPYMPVAAGTQGVFVIPRVMHDDHNVFLRVYARMARAGDEADTTYVDIHPELSTILLTSEPSGLTLTVDGIPHATPFQDTVLVGADLLVVAPDEQVFGPALWGFNAWNDTDSLSRTLRVTPTSLAFGAKYDSIGGANRPPNVVLTAPADGASVTELAFLGFSATATDVDGFISRVDFLVDTAVVHTDFNSPFGGSWQVTGVSMGEHQVTARAYDVDGETAISNTRTITVLPSGAPTISAITPANGTRGLIGDVVVSATVVHDAPIRHVQFWLDDELFRVTDAHTDTLPPYEVTVGNTANYASGPHTIFVQATDSASRRSIIHRVRVEFGGNVELPAGFTRTVVASGFAATPTSMAVAPDGRVFVTLQHGEVRVVKNNAQLPEPFVTIPVENTGERGLVGIVLDPDFATNGWVYLYHTTTQGGVHNRIVRYTAAGDVAVPGSAQVILDLPLAGPTAKHSGGAMRFASDGTLYVAVGDDGLASNAPSLDIPFGKILRINPDGTIPTDNPFYGVTTGINRAIWAKGLRNPFTFDISNPQVWINDVGQGAWEEINSGRPGADFGWPTTEGPTNDVRFVSPLIAYPHEDTGTELFHGFAVVGGTFYRPTTDTFGARFLGDYFFGDYVRGWIMHVNNSHPLLPNAFANLGGAITGLTDAPDGSLYVLIDRRLERIQK